MLIKEIMKKPYVIEKDITLKKAAELMKKHDISSIIVVNKNKVAGIITHEDLIENFSENKNVFQIMSKKVITLNENDKTDYAIGLMKKNKISILPVLDGEGHLIGVVHIKELIKQLSDGEDFLIN